MNNKLEAGQSNLSIKSLSLLIKLLSYFQVGTGFLSLIITGALGPISIVLILFCIPFSWFFDGKKYKGTVYQKLWTLAALLYLCYFFTDLILISRSLIVAVTHLLIFIQIYKLFNRFTKKDYFHLYSISFFQILAAASLTAEVSFFFPFMLFLVNSVVLYSLINSYPHPFTELEKKKDENVIEQRIIYSPQESFFSAKAFLKNKISLILSVLLGTFLIFILIPRYRAGYLRAGFADTQMVSGFSERVMLGELGRIKGNPSIVMRVQVGSKRDARRITRWRGIGFDYFDGYGWRRSDSREYWIRRNTDGLFQVRRSLNEKEFIKQIVYLEPIGSRVIFGAYRPYLVSGTFTYLLRDMTDTLYLITNSTRRRSYTVYSILPSYPLQALKKPSLMYSWEIREKYLQLPRFFNPRIRQLALEITAHSNSVYDKAANIESYLRENYNYTTDLNEYSRNPLESFLFESREGHCEYFATAMTVMLRSINIPCRLVNGFQRGEYNELGRYFIVRQRDAHSWVEVYFPEHGWVEFDPTPDTQYSDLQQLRSPFLLSSIIDSVKLAWDRYVIFYNIDDQKRFLIIIREKIDLMSRSIVQWLRIQRDYWRTLLNWQVLFKKMLIPVLLTILIAILALFYSPTRKYLSKFVLRKVNDRSVSSNITFYNKMLQILKRKGIKKPKQLTPFEFAQEIQISYPLAYATVNQLTLTYYKCRYGNEILEETDLKEIKSYLRQLNKGEYLKANG
jgi:transglutaminase-like putative cysteine protease